MSHLDCSDELVEDAKRSARSDGRCRVIYKLGEGRFASDPIDEVYSAENALIVTPSGNVFTGVVHKTFFY